MDAFLLILCLAAFFGVFSSLVYLFTLYENETVLMKNPKPKKLRSVTIIVPAFNEEGRLGRTVNSLLNLNYPKHLVEIMLVDDGSKDNTYKEMLGYASDRVKVYHKENGGKHTALNYGLERAKGEIIISLDADSFVDKDALMNMMGYFDNPKVMAVTPSMKVWKPKTILQKIQFFEYMFGIFLRKSAALLGCIHVTPGPFSAYRKSFFEKYGVYRKAHNTEDIEMALRIQSNNYVIENAPNAYSYTIGPSKFGALFSQRVRWYTGFLNNIWDYRHLFSGKYGTLGLFFLPSAFLSVFFCMILVGFALKVFLSNSYNGIMNLFSINFDFTKMLNLHIDTFYLSPTMVGLITVISIMLAISTIYIARKISHDRDKIAAPFILSMFLYAPLYALWWGTSFIYKAAGKNIKWHGVAWKKD